MGYSKLTGAVLTKTEMVGDKVEFTIESPHLSKPVVATLTISEVVDFAILGLILRDENKTEVKGRWATSKKQPQQIERGEYEKKSSSKE